MGSIYSFGCLVVTRMGGLCGERLAPPVAEQTRLVCVKCDGPITIRVLFDEMWGSVNECNQFIFDQTPGVTVLPLCIDHYSSKKSRQLLLSWHRFISVSLIIFSRFPILPRVFPGVQ